MCSSDLNAAATVIAARKDKLAKENKRKAANSRKSTVSSLLRSLCTKILTSPQLREERVWSVSAFGMRRHHLLFEMLLAQNMSADETDSSCRRAPKVFIIVRARWQSQAFMTFCWTLDDMYLEHRATKTVGGNPPRRRIDKPNSRVEDGIAPIGLWRNCYDPEWLGRLPRYRLRELQIIDSDFDFSFDPHEEDLADED